MPQEDKITYFGLTDYRNKKTKFGIKNSDRSRHVYVIGKTGMGKSTLLENMAAQDIMNGEGMCFVDPHGSAIDALLEYVPEHRVTDVVYFAPFDTQFPISFNVLEDVDADQRHLVMAGLISSFKKIWPDSFSARMEYILSNTLLALLEFPGATLLGVNRMLAEKDYRDMVIENVTDASVKAFWIDEYNKWDPRYAREAGAAIQNKIGQFTSNPTVRNIIGQEKTSFNLREMMDNRKILLVNLSKGQVGESNANLLGGMLITKLYLAAMSRADAGPQGLKKLPPFFFFVDEFQNFANESFADILAEARKYKLNLTVAHQYVDQMEEAVASAIFGNVGTMITFRIGATDAEVFEKQFAPTFTAEDIVNLGKFQIYLSLMIDGIGSRPFSASTLPPLDPQPVSMRQHIIANSRYWYCEERHIVEAAIQKWYEPVKKPERRRIAKDYKDGATTKNKENKKKGGQQKTQEKSEKHKDDEVFSQDAELEMKKIVSPKLNALLDNLGTKEKKVNKVNQVLKTIQKKNENTQSSQKKKTKKKEKEKVEKAQKEKKSVTVNNERGVKQETKSSLRDLLEKVTKETKTETKKEKNRTSAENKNEQKTKNNKQKKKKKRDIPEDLIRDILS